MDIFNTDLDKNDEVSFRRRLIYPGIRGHIIHDFRLSKPSFLSVNIR